ncbi:MAG: hypothetical protein LBS63_01495 [Prevotellaceae bacterium]|jgi:hypothetical protein|nr:hypothetical protein [Prevotellaceae bacterium]
MKNKALLLFILFNQCSIVAPPPPTPIVCYKKVGNATWQEMLQAVDSFFVQHPEIWLSPQALKHELARLPDTSCLLLSYTDAQKFYYDKQKEWRKGSFLFQFANSDTTLQLDICNDSFYGSKYMDICLRCTYDPTNSYHVIYNSSLKSKEQKQISEKFKMEFVLDIEKIIAENRKKK